MEKSNKGLYILLCVLIALLLILSGYIIYDKVLSNKDDTSSNQLFDSNIVEDGNLPEWANYLLSRNITEITYEDGIMDNNGNCNPPILFTTEQLKLILEKMTSGKLRKFDYGGGGGPCWTGISVKYDNIKFEISHGNLIFIDYNDDKNILELLEKEDYEFKETTMSDPIWVFQYDWDTSYINTLLG